MVAGEDRHAVKPNFGDAYQAVDHLRLEMAYGVKDAVTEIVVATRVVNCYCYFDYPVRG